MSVLRKERVHIILCEPVPNMGNTLRLIQVRPPQGPLDTGPRHHSARQCCTHFPKTICKWSNSCKCRQEERLCTSCFPSENCCNQTNRTPIPRFKQKVSTISRPPSNRAKITGGGSDEADTDVCRVIFHPDNSTPSPTTPTTNVVETDPLAGASATPVDQAPNKTANPESITPMSIRSGN